MSHSQLIAVGDRIAGRYEVERLLGRGGLAEVYLVKHVDLGSLHAVKVVLLQRQSVMERFLMEGRIQAQLRHPNVVAVTDILRHEGRLGLLMEYVDNVGLDVFIHRRGALPLDDALGLMAPILAGVRAAHKAGVLHRDLKPANILLARTPTGLVPKVSDFGIAKVVDEGLGHNRTREGVAMGTPGYMAPEQVLDSRSVDGRTDVFALAAILYELLSGQRAFVDDSGEVSMKATLEGRVTPLSDLVDDVPDHISAAVCRALSREREERQPDILAFARDLFVDRPGLLAWVEGTEMAKPVDVDLSLPSTLSNPGSSTGSRPSPDGPRPPISTGSDGSQPTYAASFLGDLQVRPEQGQPVWPIAALALATVLVAVGIGAMLVVPALRTEAGARAPSDVLVGQVTPETPVGSVTITAGSVDHGDDTPAIDTDDDAGPSTASTTRHRRPHLPSPGRPPRCHRPRAKRPTSPLWTQPMSHPPSKPSTRSPATRTTPSPRWRPTSRWCPTRRLHPRSRMSPRACRSPQAPPSTAPPMASTERQDRLCAGQGRHRRGTPQQGRIPPHPGPVRLLRSSHGAARPVRARRHDLHPWSGR